MDTINSWKTKGNEFFKLKDYLKAINCYEEALETCKQLELDYQRMVNIKEAHEKLNEVVGLKTILNGNLSMSHLKRNEVDEAEFYNGFVLDSDPTNVKAHFRMVQFMVARNQLEEAQEFAIKCTSMFKGEND